MNILQILPELKVGGVERGVVDLARFLVERNHKVVVVSEGGKLTRELDMAGARHYELPVGRKNLFTIIRMIPRLASIIKNESIDIVHARSRVPGWIAFFAARFTRSRFITTAHGYYRHRLSSQVMGWARYVIVASNVIARHMMDDFGVPFERIRLIPRGVDLKQFKFDPHAGKAASGIIAERGDFVVGMISRLTPIKGHTFFLKAVSMVSRVIPKLKVVIVGGSRPGKTKYKEELQLLVRRLGLARTVEFIGQQDDIPRVLSEMDLLVLPTTAPEAFGRVIIEAQACGVPVIATKVGGITDVIADGVNGILVPPEDHHSLQEAIIKVAKDASLAQRLAANARRIVEESFSLDRMAEETLKVYQKAMNSFNILVIKISALGDVVLAIPSLRAIRSKFPDADIRVLVGLQSRQILKDCPYIDGLIVCDLKEKDKAWRNIFKLGNTLRSSSFDMVIDLQNSRLSHLLSFLSLAPLRYGYRNGKWSFFLNRTVEESKIALDPVAHQFRTLKKVGIDTSDWRLELWPSGEDKKWTERFLEENWLDLKTHTLVGLNPGGSTRWVTKRWGVGNYAKLCDELAKKFGTRVVVMGTKEDLPLARQLRSATKSKPLVAAGKTDLMKLATLIERCRLLVTGDSAPVHIAASMDTPYVALFGPTDPRRHIGPYEKGTLIYKKLSCSPCYRPKCRKNSRCMKKITVDEVVEAVGKYL